MKVNFFFLSLLIAVVLTGCDSIPKSTTSNSDSIVSHEATNDISNDSVANTISQKSCIDIVQPGEGYCKVQINGTELFIIAHSTYEVNGQIVSLFIDAYLDNSEEPLYIGHLAGSSSAYPIYYGDGIFVVAGNDDFYEWGYSQDTQQFFVVYSAERVLDDTGEVIYLDTKGEVLSEEAFYSLYTTLDNIDPLVFSIYT